MRQIKFRAWHALEKRMIYSPELDVAFHPDGSIYAVLQCPDGVAHVPVLQFTGLLDREGVEIYESDILHNPSWWWGNCFVYWNQGECGPCSGDSVGSYLLAQNLDNPAEDAVHNIWNGREVEVIGNIHQHPELLK